MPFTTHFTTHFFGNEISKYGQENHRVDYRTLAKAFDAVLANSLVEKTGWENWETENGYNEYYEDSDGNTYDYSGAQDKIEELEKEQENYDEDSEEWRALQEDIDRLNDVRFADIFQYFVISSNGADILKQYTDEIVMYNEELDLYVWGVTHFGTSWDYVLTDIPCGESEEE